MNDWLRASNSGGRTSESGRRLTVAREIGVNDTTLGFWVKAYKKKISGQPLPAGMPDADRIRELERRNRELEAENAFLKKAAAFFAREQR